MAFALARREEIRHRTGHDVHFLSRLGRVDPNETELALRLYRTPGLVKEILGDRELPGGASRVAIAIADVAYPPHVVVERNGAFVTCLGAGMTTDGLPVLSWKRLELHRHRFETRHARLRRAHDLLSDQDTFKSLFSRFYDLRRPLDRDEFLEAQALAPLSENTYARMCCESFLDAHRYGNETGRLPHPTPRSIPFLQRFWRVHEAAGHYLLLSHTGPRGSFDLWGGLFGSDVENNPFERYLHQIMMSGQGPLMLRALWATARLGKVALPWVKHALAVAINGRSWTTAALALLTLGFAHRKLRGEVIRTLVAARAPSETGDHAWWSPALQTMLCDHAEYYLASSEPLAETLELRCRSWATQKLRIEDGPLAAAVPAQADRLVSLDVATTRLASRHFDFSRPNEALEILLIASPVIARARADQFYAPPALLDALVDRYGAERALKRARMWHVRAEPVGATERPGRNRPCTCNSGLKFKRCCGLAS